jgi:threonine dehydratase
MTKTIDLSLIEEAAERIAPMVARTPALEGVSLGALSGARVSLKLETRQRTGAFKDRGAANRILQLEPHERERGVIAMSAGNHAQSVAYICQRLGIPATIVMPEGTPFTKVRRTQGFGARVVIAGSELIEAEARARRIMDEEGLTLVHPYDDLRVIAGQGTAALEWLAEVPDLDVLLVPIGGGGLISGIALAAKALNPSIEIVGVQTELFPSVARRREGLPPLASGQSTIAEGIAVKAAGDLPMEIIDRLVDDVVLVSEQAIERAIHLFLEEEKLLTEGAGAAPLAALLKDRQRYAGRHVGLIVSGGNLDTGLLAHVITRVRMREGRVVSLRMEIPDRPGVLADISTIIGASGANIIEVKHQRLFHDVPSKHADLDITIETRDPGDIDEILAKLVARNYSARLLISTRAHTS